MVRVPKPFPKRFVFSGEYRLPRGLREFDEILEVMQGKELSSKQFSRLEKMSEISERIRFRYVRFELGQHRYPAFFKSVFFIGYLHVSKARHRHFMTPEARGQNAVEHVDSAVNAFDEVFRSSNAHEVPRLVGREMGRDGIENGEHFFFRFPYRQSADGHTDARKRSDEFYGFHPEFRIHDPLRNGKQRLFVQAFRGSSDVLPHALAKRTFRPAMGSFHGGAGIGFVRSSRSALVEGHDDVGTEIRLDPNGFFRRKKTLRAVQVGAEFDALFGNLRKGLTVGGLFSKSERKHLETSAVGKYREIDVHESVEASKMGYRRFPGTQMEVVRIRKHDFRSNGENLLAGYALNAGLRSDGHENRGRHGSVGGLENARSRVPARSLGFEGKPDGALARSFGNFEFREFGRFI